MKASARPLKLLVSRNGDIWTLTQGSRRLGAFSTMREAMAAVKLFADTFQHEGYHCELVVEEERVVESHTSDGRFADPLGC